LKLVLVLALAHVCAFSVYAEASGFGRGFMEDHVVSAFGLYLLSLAITVALGILIVGGPGRLIELWSQFVRWLNRRDRHIDT